MKSNFRTMHASNRRPSFPGLAAWLLLAGGLMGIAGIAPSAQAQTESVLYSFTGGADGRAPVAGVIMDAQGNLYGTTDEGGASDVGVVFKLDPSGHETVLYTFTGGADGLYAHGVILDAQGNLYGTTTFGGDLNVANGLGAGVVFKVDPSGHETVLYAFTDGADGGYPYGVILDAQGNLYGTTNSGGTGYGVVFKVDPSGHETVLYAFTDGADGGYPHGVILDAQGNLYGTTAFGGTYGAGVVFKVDPSGHETVLYTFTGGADGYYPDGVILDAQGNLYGTTLEGGDLNANVGVVFKLNPSGHETVLYTFTGGADGSHPGGVILDAQGNLYGTTYEGGDLNFNFNNSLGAGVVFELDPSGTETILRTFTGGADGAGPSAVIQDAQGNLYGTTELGGDLNVENGFGAGVVFKLDPNLVIPFQSVKVKPKSVKGGKIATGTVTLKTAAPIGGVVVTLTSSDPAVASVPSAVIVPSGQTSVAFTITTTEVSQTTKVTISANDGGATKSAKLTVKK